MEKYELSEDEFHKILATARWAPSVHNTQPWSVSRTEQGLRINIDRAHKLGSGDPVGRQTIISLGIFAEAAGLAAEDLGFKVKEVKLQEDVATINLTGKGEPGSETTGLIKKRASDRSIYKPAQINKKAQNLITKMTSNKSVKVWFIDDKKFIEKLAALTSKGIGLALSNPEFRAELSSYLLRPWSKKKRGISVSSLYIPFWAAILQPELLKLGLNTGQEAKLEEKRWLSASAVILITTEGDFHNDWFEAGRTYLNISLAVEKLGLSQATSAATVEASTFHEDVEEMLGTKQRLQAVIRVGKGSDKKQYSPRISVEELIT